MKLSDAVERLVVNQDYARPDDIEGVKLLPLRRHRDDGGSMTEIARFAAGVPEGVPGFRLAQVNFSTLAAGAIKAFHLHRRQTDIWFVPPADRVLVVLSDARAGSPSEGKRMRFVLGDADSRLLVIPPGVAHGCRNLGASAATLVYLTDVPFSPAPELTDEGRLPWDFLGEGIWDVRRD